MINKDNSVYIFEYFDEGVLTYRRCVPLNPLKPREAVLLKEKHIEYDYLENFLEKADIHTIDSNSMGMVGRLFQAECSLSALEYGFLPRVVSVIRYHYLLKKLSATYQDARFVIQPTMKGKLIYKLMAVFTPQVELGNASLLKKWGFVKSEASLQRQMKWRNSSVRNFMLEPLLLFGIFLLGQARRLQRSRPLSKTKPTLLILGDRFTLPVYNKLKSKNDWQFIIAGKTFPGRKLFSKKDEVWLEELLPFLKLLLLPLYSIEAWMLWRRIQSTLATKCRIGKHDFWDYLRGDLKRQLLINLPLTRLVAESVSAATAKTGKTVAVMANDVIDYNRAIVNQCQKCQIKTCVIQHGFMLEPNGHSIISADKVAGWGQGTIDWYVELGNAKGKISITGNPRYDSFPLADDRRRKRISRKPIILVGTDFVSGFSSEETYLRNFQLLDALAEGVKDRDAEIVIKPHPGETKCSYLDFVAAHSKFSIATKDNLQELLREADVFVTNYSTTVLEASALKIPIILFCLPYQRELIPLKSWGTVLFAQNGKDISYALHKLDQEGSNPKRENQQKRFVTHYAGDMRGRNTEKVIRLLSKLMG